MVERLIKKYESVSFKNGKFLSDKSYAYDTVYFLTKFVRDHSVDGIYYHNKFINLFKLYIADVFNKDADNSDIGNYYSDFFHVLIYAGVLSLKSHRTYKILDYETINYICEKMENAYIFLYILVYFTMKNSGTLELYKRFCEGDKEDKKKYLNKIHKILHRENPSVQGSIYGQWSLQNTEYLMNVLNFINEQPRISRELNIYDNKIKDIEMISVNVNGSRTIRKKNNAYLESFDYAYVKNELKDLMIRK